ncbi:putative methyltransferase-like protein 24 [Saccoglossus kowalevskii]|uniref:Methyltransferase-like protein 24-like n=1 Tax=Saccoglossus kowalevskii TaxID=10224 RepID=A0ABM0M287_SACKO|nr:PREDICTED: methyltransferase-like protein 24-like [Saccoglossus kowalevskii]
MGIENHRHSERVWFYNIGLYGDNVDNLQVRGSYWKARTLSSIREMLHHGNTIIDVLKFDIEGGEFLIFHQLIRSGMLSDIKVIVFELHLAQIMASNDRDMVLNCYRALKMAFEQNGFKLWRLHENEIMAEKHPDSPFRWVELYWVNMKYIKQKN